MPLTQSQRAVTEKADFAQPEYSYADDTHGHRGITQGGTGVVGDLRKSAFAESRNWLFITAHTVEHLWLLANLDSFRAYTRVYLGNLTTGHRVIHHGL